MNKCMYAHTSTYMHTVAHTRTCEHICDLLNARCWNRSTTKYVRQKAKGRERKRESNWANVKKTEKRMRFSLHGLIFIVVTLLQYNFLGFLVLFVPNDFSIRKIMHTQTQQCLTLAHTTLCCFRNMKQSNAFVIYNFFILDSYAAFSM